MRVIGLVGGVAGGKSLVAGQLERLGAALVSGDQAGHEVLRDEDVIRRLRDRWGEAVVTSGGQIDRRAVANIVFGPGAAARAELEFLENVTHPRIKALLQQRVAAADREIVVLDAAVLIEAGWDDICDTIVFVDTPREIRLARALGRGWSQEDFAAREAAQESLNEKRKRADLVIDNSGGIETTRPQVAHLWHSLA